MGEEEPVSSLSLIYSKSLFLFTFLSNHLSPIYLPVYPYIIIIIAGQRSSNGGLLSQPIEDLMRLVERKRFARMTLMGGEEEACDEKKKQEEESSKKKKEEGEEEEDADVEKVSG